MGLLYQGKNDLESAVTNFEKYLELGAAGPYSDSVKTALEKIKQPTSPGVANGRTTES